MPRILRPRRAVVVLGLVSGALIAGCGGDGEVRASDVERLGSESLEAQGFDDVEMDCPDGIDGEEGATLTCTATYDGAEYDVDVTVVSMEDDKANLDFTVAGEAGDGDNGS